MGTRDGMTRRGLLLLAAIAATIGPARADEAPAIMDPGSSPPAMLYQALERQAHERLEARRREVAALKTPEDLRARNARLRARFFEALGELPERTPLNARVIGVDRRDGYRVERVIYESRPVHHVTANLYLPDGDPPFPAVLMPCGHDDNGKASASYQRACILLARNGIAALCYDPIGQAERRQLLDPDGKPAGPGNSTEHTLAGVGALLVGRSTAGYRVWDGLRSLDYLASRPAIDPNRLGCTGCSGGGTLTSYLMALDDRIVAAAPSCYITSLDRLFATLGPQDAEQNITGQVAFGLDHADYLGLRAPKPTLVLSSTRDFFDQHGTWETFREATQTYGKLGHPERVAIVEVDEPHGYNKAHREAMTGWMRRWLVGKDDAPAERDEAIVADAALQCTRTGQVLSDLGGKSVFDLNAGRAVELARLRPEVQARLGKAGLLAEVRRLIALPETIAPARRADRGEIPRVDGTARKLVFATEAGIEVPALLLTPAGVNADAPLAVLIGFDRAGAIAPGGPVEGLLRDGRRVLVADLRGMGETAPAAGTPCLLGGDVREAFLGLHLGRPLVGQRVGDLLAVIAAMADESRGGIQLFARGAAGPIGLHAAALEPRITAVSLDGAVTSWSAVVRTPLSREQLANVVPGALAVYDLPDLAAAIAPRALTIGEPADPAGR